MLHAWKTGAEYGEGPGQMGCCQIVAGAHCYVLLGWVGWLEEAKRGPLPSRLCVRRGVGAY